MRSHITSLLYLIFATLRYDNGNKSHFSVLKAQYRQFSFFQNKAYLILFVLLNSSAGKNTNVEVNCYRRILHQNLTQSPVFQYVFPEILIPKARLIILRHTIYR